MPTSLITENTLLVLVGLFILVINLVPARVRAMNEPVNGRLRAQRIHIVLAGLASAIIVIGLVRPAFGSSIPDRALQNATSEVTPSPSDTATPFNTPTAQPSLTPTMSETPIVLYTPLVYQSTYALTTPTSCSVIATTMAYLRGDPSETMASIGTLFAGSYLNVTGRVANKQWWQVISTDGTVSVEGWVRADYVTADSACTDSAVPVIGPTETPTRAPTKTTQNPMTAAPCTLLTTVSASLRPDPSLQQVPLAQVPAGTAFTPIKKSADGPWWNASYRGQDGWIVAGTVFVSASCSAILAPTSTLGAS